MVRPKKDIDIDLVVRMRSNGKTFRAIAKEHGEVSHVTIRQRFIETLDNPKSSSTEQENGFKRQENY